MYVILYCFPVCSAFLVSHAPLKTEGSEEMSVQVSRETRQASKINQICTKIDELLTQDLNRTVVKISIPELDNVDVCVLEAICNQYKTEILEEKMFIKLDGGNKEAIQFRLCTSAAAQNQRWWVAPNQMCSLVGSQTRPDIGVWFARPTYIQRHRPLVNPCPPADVWMELFFNRDPDRANALRKLGWMRQNNLAIEYVGIAMPDSSTPYRQNPNPGIASIPATPTNPNVRPYRAPYFVYWDGNNTVYYRVNWNQHLVLQCGWTLEFNDVFEVLSLP